jgi:multidrug efflux pump subunit AcrA (membrane-fusion protein)
MTALRLPSDPRRRRMAVSGLILAGAALASLSIFATGPDAKPELRPEKAWPVSVVTIEPEALNPVFTAFGKVESNDVARIRTDIVARVVEVAVKEGDWVAEGDLLVRLDDAEVGLELDERRADLQQHQATLRSIETDYALARQTTSHFESMQRVADNRLERHHDLMKQRLISSSLMDEVVAQANQATIEHQNHMRQIADFPNRIAAQKAIVAKTEALAARAELDLAKTVIRAPFGGPVLAVLVARGDRSNLGAPLIEMAAAEGFEVRVQVPDDYGARFRQYLNAGTAITARSPAMEPLHLTRIAGQVRTGQTGLDAFFALGRDPPAALGRVVEVRITLPSEADVIALPPHAIYESDRIYRVLEGRLQAVTVERVGEYEDAEGGYHVLVRSPELETGATVITTQLPRAISGLLVEPVNS